MIDILYIYTFLNLKVVIYIHIINNYQYHVVKYSFIYFNRIFYIKIKILYYIMSAYLPKILEKF